MSREIDNWVRQLQDTEDDFTALNILNQLEAAWRAIEQLESRIAALEAPTSAPLRDTVLLTDDKGVVGVIDAPLTVTPTISIGKRVNPVAPDFLAEIAVQPNRKPLRLTAGNSQVLAKIKHDFNKTIYKWCLKDANVRGLEADAISKLLVYVRISRRSEVAAEYEALIKHASEGPQDIQSGDTEATTAVD